MTQPNIYKGVCMRNNARQLYRFYDDTDFINFKSVRCILNVKIMKILQKNLHTTCNYNCRKHKSDETKNQFYILNTKK